jgi:hypothetical protein
MFKLLNGDLISLDEVGEARQTLSKLLNISPYRIQLIRPEKGEVNDDNDEKGDENVTFVFISEKDRVKLPIPLDKLDNYSFLMECTNESVLKTCLTFCKNTNYTHPAWLCLVKNPSEIVVQHLFTAFADLASTEFYRTLSGNPNDRVVNWLLDEHPDKIHLALFLCNKNPRVVDYIMNLDTHILHQFHSSQYSDFLRRVVHTKPQMEWAFSNLVNAVMTVSQFETTLFGSEVSECIEWFKERYPTPVDAYNRKVLLPPSYSEELLPYYLHYLTNYSDEMYDVLSFAATHPHPEIVKWWMNRIDEILAVYSYRDLSSTDILGRFLKELHANPSDVIIDWLLQKPFLNKFWFGRNRNSKARDMCLSELRKGWPGNKAISDFLLNGMRVDVAVFVMTEYPEECRKLLMHCIKETYASSCMWTLTESDDYEFV